MLFNFHLYAALFARRLRASIDCPGFGAPRRWVASQIKSGDPTLLLRPKKIFDLPPHIRGLTPCNALGAG